VDTVLVRRDSSDVTLSNSAAPPLPADSALPRPLPDGLRLADDAHARDGRAAMIIDEWGPYDWRSPKLWPAGPASASPLPLRVLGPPGTWRVAGRRGIAALSAAHGSTGDTIVVTPVSGSEGDWELNLEYRGQATVSPRGTRRPAGAPYRFSFARFEPAAGWQVQFFAWADSTDPRTRPEAFRTLLAGPPLLSRAEPRLDYMWYRPTITALPPERFAAVATTSVNLAAGEYTLRTISDDAVRVWVDGRLVVDNWKPHESLVDHAPIAAGRHDIRVEYVQVDGWAELRVEIVRGSQRSDGSPGPH
jgi:hypothetical protein